MLLNFLNLLIIFSILMGFVWFIYKKSKNSALGVMKKSEYIKMVDQGIQVGIGQKLSIVKVEEEYFLFTYGQSGVAFQPLKKAQFDSQRKLWEKEVMGEVHQESFEELGEIFKNEK